MCECVFVCVCVCPASVLQAMAVLVCAEMYQVKRLQHLCEVCVCAYLQSMPSRELASTGISVVRLLRRAKVSWRGWGCVCVWGGLSATTAPYGGYRTEESRVGPMGQNCCHGY